MNALLDARLSLYRAMEAERSLLRCDYLYRTRDALNTAGLPRLAEIAGSAAERIGGSGSGLDQLLFKIDALISRQEHAL